MTMTSPTSLAHLTPAPSVPLPARAGARGHEAQLAAHALALRRVDASYRPPQATMPHSRWFVHRTDRASRASFHRHRGDARRVLGQDLGLVLPQVARHARDGVVAEIPLRGRINVGVTIGRPPQYSLAPLPVVPLLLRAHEDLLAVDGGCLDPTRARERGG